MKQTFTLGTPLSAPGVSAAVEKRPQRWTDSGFTQLAFVLPRLGRELKPDSAHGGLFQPRGALWQPESRCELREQDSHWECGRCGAALRGPPNRKPCGCQRVQRGLFGCP